MNNNTFKTLPDALNAGYVKARAVSEEYRGFRIWSKDLSGRNSVGYSYALTTFPLDQGYGVPVPECFYSVWQEKKQFGKSVHVHLTDTINLIGQPGAFSVMYDPATLASGIAQAKAYIDTFYASNPEAREYESRVSLVRNAIEAESKERQRQRDIKRAHKLAAKYGAENIATKWQALLSDTTA